MLAFIAIVCASLVAVTAAPANVTSLDKRAVIADGNSVRTGTLPDWQFKYRSAGYVAKGCPPGTGISICYQYRLSSDPTKNLDTNSNGQTLQRNEFFSATKPADGKVREYKFKLKVDSPVASASLFNRLPIVGLDTGEGVPNPGNPGMAVYLAIRGNTAGIYTRDNPGVPVQPIPLSQFAGRRTEHTWTHKSGPGGYIRIIIRDDITKNILVNYVKPGQFSSGTYRMRVGTRRYVSNAMPPVRVFWGDWSGKYIN
ncbi:hypothetical protein RhiJN_27028 [Ceratobasidium sp. AG-Ba]|nr:hypothetical protein RhiJN_27028 [Ceratobasidium sp. AG-Ba]